MTPRPAKPKPGDEENPHLPQIHERMQKQHDASKTLRAETEHLVKEIEDAYKQSD
jgi:hypothetical protein